MKSESKKEKGVRRIFQAPGTACAKAVQKKKHEYKVLEETQWDKGKRKKREWGHEIEDGGKDHIALWAMPRNFFFFKS